jgi:hypothetical protein
MNEPRRFLSFPRRSGSSIDGSEWFKQIAIANPGNTFFYNKYANCTTEILFGFGCLIYSSFSQKPQYLVKIFVRHSMKNLPTGRLKMSPS